jgi:hypothetical protein
MPMIIPQIGQIVWVQEDGQAGPTPAIVTHVDDYEAGALGLTLFSAQGLLRLTKVYYMEKLTPGFWSYPYYE